MSTREETWRVANGLLDEITFPKHGVQPADVLELAAWLHEGSEGPSETMRAQQAIDGAGDDESAPEAPAMVGRGGTPLHRRVNGQVEFAYVINGTGLVWATRAKVRAVQDDGHDIQLLHI